MRGLLGACGGDVAKAVAVVRAFFGSDDPWVASRGWDLGAWRQRKDGAIVAACEAKKSDAPQLVTPNLGARIRASEFDPRWLLERLSAHARPPGAGWTDAELDAIATELHAEHGAPRPRENGAVADLARRMRVPTDDTERKRAEALRKLNGGST